MNADEAAHQAAVQRAADLFHLGWEKAAGAAIWARAVSDELARHEQARARYSEGTGNMEVMERIYGSALMLVVAVEQVLAFEKRVRSMTGDAELAKARKRFDAAFPHAEAIRDIAAHLDAYAVGGGTARRSGVARRGSRSRSATSVRSSIGRTAAGRSCGSPMKS